MVKYLFADAIDDKLTFPAMQFTSVELDMAIESAVSWGKYFSFNYKWFQRNSSTNNDQWDTSAISLVYKNGIAQTNLTDFVVMGERAIFKVELSASVNVVSYLFANMGTTQSGGRLYSAKFYNGTTLQAHYDMSTGTVQDQSGNGNHATLTGGTWMDDGTGGTPTVHEGESILSSVSNLTVEPILIYNGESTLSAISDMIAETTVIQSAEVILSASSDLTPIPMLIVDGETVLLANSDLLAEVENIRLTADLSAVSTLIAVGELIRLTWRIDEPITVSNWRTDEPVTTEWRNETKVTSTFQ